MDAYLTSILNSPRLPLIFNDIKNVLNEEAIKRARFLNEISDGEKAEFINGKVILHSPVRFEHLSVSRMIIRIIDGFVIKHDLGFIGTEKMMISLTRNDYEPDICFFSKQKTRKFIKGQMRFPAPDFIVEILSDSTEKYDRGVKFEDYAVHGVGEYWIIDADNLLVEQYQLNNDKYDLIVKSDKGIIKCKILNGLEIPIRAIFDEVYNIKFLQSI